MQQLTLNVTKLVQTTKEKHLLFYPLVIHTLLCVLQTKTNKTVICEQPDGVLIKTNFHPDFFVFYKNYVNDCFFNTAADLSDKEIVSFALSAQSFPNADFTLMNFEEKDSQTFLSVVFNIDVPADFEACCQEAILSL